MVGPVARLIVLAGAVLAAAPVAAQWREFRGPTGQGHSAERGLPLSWSDTEHILWRVPVPGQGWSSPVVADERVWLTTAVEGRGGAALRVLAFEARSGRQLLDVELFKASRNAALNPKNSLASPTPIVVGDRVFVHFGADGTAALDTSGAVLWRTRLDYESQHGNGGSPAVYDDLLIINCDGGDQAYVVALDQATGRERWKTRRRQPSDQAYTTPLVIDVNGQSQLVSVGAYRAAAYELRTGRELWRVSYGSGFSNVPRPVYGHGLVYIATGFHQPAILAVRPDGTGDVTRTHVVWTLTRGAPFTPSPILVGTELLVVSDIGILTCVDAKTGAILWQQRLGGNYSASPVYADGRVYFQSEEGVTTVIAPGRTFERLAESRLDDVTLASLAVAHGSFYLRGRSHLYRIGVTRER
jgi:outer membrane protein assembly factor BamB